MPMHAPAILYPVFALALLTFLVLNLIPLARFRAAARREVTIGDFRYGESAAVPPGVSLPNRNYMNLLEQPVLFYVICVLIYATDAATPVMLALAWSYVGLRCLHTLIHLAYNNVMHRLAVFAISNVVLIVLWVDAFMSLPGR